MIKKTLRLTILLGASLALVGPTAQAGGEGLDSIMLRDPDLPVPLIVQVFPKELIPIWLEYLARPEIDFKTRAAVALADAHRRGMQGVGKTVPKLIEELEKPNQPEEVRMALVQTLATLDAKEAADAMFRASRTGAIDVRQIVDPCLTRWQYEPVRTTWLERISKKPSQRGTILAIQGLRAAKDTRAIPRLREIVQTAEEWAPVRLEAASALAELQPEGLEGVAEGLANDRTSKGVIARIVAARILSKHSSPKAISLLQSFVADQEPAVAAQALSRLIELDPIHFEPVLAQVLKYTDATVRTYGVQALERTPTTEHIQQIAQQLADEHPQIRTQCRLSLLNLAKEPKHRATVIAGAMKTLDGSNWGGLQQAALIVGQLGHKPAEKRLMQLLDHERSEVYITAAWSLRTLNQADTLPAIFAIYERRFRTFKDPANVFTEQQSLAHDEQFSQLLQLMGQQRYAPASAAMIALIPPNSGPVETRAAAIWALGKIHEGQKNRGYEKDLEVRLNATMPGMEEAPIVRRMCAITLGRVLAEETLPSLRRYYVGKPSNEEVSNSCGWAIENITGEKMPAPEIAKQPQINFFAIPIDINQK